MNNDEVREAIKGKGITSDNVTETQLRSLFKILQRKLRESDCFEGTYRVFNRKPSKFMTCSAHYFKNRELVSFNRDGFIGFAGWSDSKNVKPIHDSIIEWLTH